VRVHVIEAPMRAPLHHRIAIGTLAVVHVLGALGAPFAAKLHLYQPGATRHQNFHVVWEACKYFGASILALYVVLGPLARGERWAKRVMLAATIALFGGVFVGDLLTLGAPSIDHWAYGTFLALSLASLAALSIEADRATVDSAASKA
jgi:hypothetical protein